MIKPCDVVPYKLSKNDVEAATKKGSHQNSKGNIVPLIVVRVWEREYEGHFPGVNGQLILDGEITLWVTSVREFKAGYWGSPSLEYDDGEKPVSLDAEYYKNFL